MFCRIVQISVTSFSNVSAWDIDFLDTWETDRVYNLTWSRYSDAVNVTINDYLGNSSYANISTIAGSVDGFAINMGRSTTRNVYLDEWNEVDCGTVSATSSSTSNSTSPGAPTNFTIAGTFSTLVPLSWDASDSWDQVRIRKSNSTYPLLPGDGDNVYFGPRTSTSDVVDPATTTYYSAFGYDNETGLYSVNHAIAKHVSSQLRAFFSYSPSHIKISDTVTFNDLSSGDIILWSWDFGDGHTSNGKQQSHDYTESGRYQVSLLITDAGGYKDKYTTTVSISSFVDPSIPPPEEPENFEGYPISGMYDRLKVTDLPVSDNKITVVVLDTGFTPTTYDGINMQNVKGYALSRFETIHDDNGHGTFVLYEIMYITQNKCPNADIVSFKTFDKYGSAEPGDFLDALDAIKYLNPDIVSISAGAIGNPNDEYSRKVKELRERGIIVIAAAAGNLGPTPGTILSPACSDHAIAVGSFDTKGTLTLADDEICDWSSRGPVPGISPKPDVVAPGESIRGPWIYTEKSKSGTSMSTPLIVGGTAIVVAQNKPLLDIVKTVYFWNLGVVGDAYEGALKDSCTLLGDENAWGAGVPDFVEVNDNFRNRLVLLISIPIVIIVLISVIAIYFYKRK
jgi:serine protease AprX